MEAFTNPIVTLNSIITSGNRDTKGWSGLKSLKSKSYTFNWGAINLYYGTY